MHGKTDALYAKAQLNGDHLYCQCCASWKKKNTWTCTERGHNEEKRSYYQLRDDTEYAGGSLFIGNVDRDSCKSDDDIRQVVEKLWMEKGTTCHHTVSQYSQIAVDNHNEVEKS